MCILADPTLLRYDAELFSQQFVGISKHRHVFITSGSPTRYSLLVLFDPEGEAYVFGQLSS